MLKGDKGNEGGAKEVGGGGGGGERGITSRDV